jgi:hypothetical protein
MFPILQLLLLGGVAHNTAVTAANAAMPEYVKEANYLAQGFFQQLRRKYRFPRFVWNVGMIFTSGILFVGCLNGENLGFILAAQLIGWYVINSYMSASAMNKALERAWSIINEKQNREEMIQNAMYSAAVNRLQLQ